MMSAYASARDALAFMPELLAFRCLPYAAYAIFAAKLSMPARILAAVAYLASVGLALAVDPTCAHRLLFVLAGMAYYGAAACAVHQLAAPFARGRIDHGALFVLCAFVFVCLPCLLHPGLAIAPSQVLGWELALGAYSYCVEVNRARARSSVRGCLFFLLVSQTLVFTSRGEPLENGEPRRSGLARALGGCAVLWLGLALQLVGMSVLASVAPGGLGTLSYPGILAYGVFRFCVEYAGHSGRASVAIGTMRLLGWKIPERYNYPFLAKSPEDFWRRWNRYVGNWFQRYIYWPLLRRMSAYCSVRSRWWSLCVSASLVVNFALLGLVHDVDLAFRTMQMRIDGVAAFMMVGVVIIAGNAARQRLLASRQQWSPWRRAATTLITQLVMINVLAISAYAFLG